MRTYLGTLGKYATFKGRASRSEFWIFVLVQTVIVIAVSYLERWLAIANPEIYFGWFTALFVMATLVPGLAVTVRRLHDIGATGWWSLLLLIPLVGLLVILILALIPGRSDENRHGLSDQQFIIS